MSSIVDDEVKAPEEEQSEEQDQPRKGVLIDEHGEPLQPGEQTRKVPLYRRPAFLIAAVLIILVGGFLGIRYWLHARSHESTDDAFIDAHITQVSPKVSGYISKVYIESNQQVIK